jgi:hypothetical protein
MPKLLLLAAGTAALLAAVAIPTSGAEATISMAPASIIQAAVGETSRVEQARVACTHRRVCRQGAGCAWRKVCKRW